jgi:hypothetical protein
LVLLLGHLRTISTTILHDLIDGTKEAGMGVVLLDGVIPLAIEDHVLRVHHLAALERVREEKGGGQRREKGGRGKGGRGRRVKGKG